MSYKLALASCWRFQPAGIDYLFVVFADVFEHILDAVRDFIGIIDRRKIASPEPLVKKAVLYTLFPSVPLGAVILMFFQLARHCTFGYVSKRVEVQPFSQFSAFPCTNIPPVTPRRKMIQCVHQRFAKTFFRMLSGIERISAEEIPMVGVAAPYHPLIPFPAVSAQTLEMLLHKPFCFVLVPEHRRKLLQQLCLTILAFALDLFKPLLELLQFLALFRFLPLPFLPVRAFRVRYRYPMAPVVVNLCREKVHLPPPRISADPRVSAILFVLFSCKFLSSD